MPAWSDLLPFVVLAALGALHCAGMCGGFAVAVAQAAGPGRRRFLLHQAAYGLGKALTYAVLGLVAARAGGALAGLTGGPDAAGDPHAGFEVSRRVLAWFAGGTLVIAGVSASGLLPARGPRPGGLLARAMARARSALAAVRSLPGAGGSLGVGLLTGLLPCGLSAAGLALALVSPPDVAVAGMFLFGLATTPALVLAACGWRLVPERLRRRGSRLLGPALVLLGLVTLARGGLPGPLSAGEAALPPCCRGEGHPAAVEE